MSTHRGVVETVFQNKAGFYAVKLPDGWYGTGSKKDPGLAQGDMIEFTWTSNGQYKNIDPKTLIKLEGAPSGNNQPRTSGNTNSWVPDVDRQKSIIYQSSRKDAIEIIKAALSAGCLPLPAKKAEQFDSLLALVDELTVKLAIKATAADLSTETVVEGVSFDE